MTTLDQARRLAVLVLVVMSLLLVPSVATARFTAARTPTFAVGTARMSTPASVAGTYRCALPFITEGIDVTISSFADSGPAGASYDYTITGRNQSRSVSSSNRSASLSSPSVLNDLAPTHWTLTIRSRLGSWTGSPYSRTITCPGLGSASGAL
jgi:hypothetical protein